MLTVKNENVIPAMLDDQVEQAQQAEDFIRDKLTRVTCCTEHTIHDGIYSRTLFMPAGSIVAGVLIKVPTTLILSGKMVVYVGEDTRHIDGYNVLTTMGNRKQVVYAIEDSYATLLFKTNAKTVEEAERDMTDEYDKLMSHDEDSINLINITGV